MGYCLLAGVTLFFGASGLFLTYRNGAPLSIGLPIVLLGTIVFGLFLSFLVGCNGIYVRTVFLGTGVCLSFTKSSWFSCSVFRI